MQHPSPFNVVIMGVSCFDGMASSMRVRNLLEASNSKSQVIIHNLIYEVDAIGLNDKRGNLKGIEYEVVKANGLLSLVPFLFKAIRFLKRAKSSTKKNILYHYEYLDIKNIMVVWAARALGYRIILDIVEDNSHYEEFPSFKNRFKIASSRFLLRHTPSVAHAVLTISHHLKKLMEEACKGKIPIHLIPITVDLSRFMNIDYKKAVNTRIFYGGSFGLKDGIDSLIVALGKLSVSYPTLELVLTGRASEADAKRLHRYLNDSPVKDRISFMGFLDDETYYKTLNGCDIFCMTRTNSKFANSGFPFKLGEFLATGKAVIATNVGDVTKYLVTGKSAIIISPDVQDELEEALLLLLENPNLIKSIGQEGRIVAEQEFDTEIWATKLLSIFKSA